MSVFLRLLSESDKAQNMMELSRILRKGEKDERIFEVEVEFFAAIPGTPFAYWISDDVREMFTSMEPFESDGLSAKQGLATSHDFRFVRTWWETKTDTAALNRWVSFSKGGAYSPFYSDIYLAVNWAKDGAEIKEEVDRRYSHIKGYQTFWVVKNPDCYLTRGLTWALRTQRFGPRVLPASCIFGHKGPIIIDNKDRDDRLLATLAICLSKAYNVILATQLNAADATARSFEIGVLQRTVMPKLTQQSTHDLATLAHQGWSLMRRLDTVREDSHAFLLPALLQSRLGEYDPPTIKIELEQTQEAIDRIAFDLYGFTDIDRQVAVGEADILKPDNSNVNEDNARDSKDNQGAIDALLSWAVGVVFGRFDWRLATGEREAPFEPNPFDPLPSNSPGMLPGGDAPFYEQASILVDDLGHPHDLVRLIESVLETVDLEVPDDIRRWLRKDFFKQHLSLYSRSRRKAPIYWPLSTPSGNYTLWIYYPALASQTLYIAVNDFVEPKLKEVGNIAQVLRSKSARSVKEEGEFALLQDLEVELQEFRETILSIAKHYVPNHDDGVQNIAAPLWSLFQHKPWRKVLEDTWTKLEKGDYDWAHMAMNYWPDRVREKSKTDKSLAIAQGLEDVYSETT